MRFFKYILFLPFLVLEIHAQEFDMDLFKNMNMRHIGPASMSGRVTSIDVVNEDPQVIYAGTASGGLWKSESGGVSWDPIFDDQPVQSIGAVAIDQNNPSVIWAGTGEGNPRNSHTSGAGIFKSLDAGRTWKFMGLEKTRTIHRIIIHRDNPDIVHVAVTGSAWGPNKERGVYRTKDGGKTWEQILYLNDSTGCADLVVDPSNPNKLIAAMWEFGRKPHTFNSGGEGSGIHITVDGGDSWIKLTDKQGLPKGQLGRVGLAIAASNPKVVYALVESKKTGLYKSSDGGYNWTLVSTENIGNRPFYYADIFVDPQNENRIFNLYSMVSKSEDGGKTFKVILPYSGVHPDHHAFWIHPENPDYMIDGNDGGLNISRDGGDKWEYITNLPLGQFYHINYDMDVPYHVYGGMQDNGSWQGPAYVWHSGGIRNEDWKELYFGDGFDVVSRPKNSRYAYAMSQGGNVAEVDIHTGRTRNIKPVHPEGKDLRFNWNAAIAQDPFSDCGVYFGSQYVHFSNDCGSSWKIISPDLTTNDSTKQKQAISGGLTIDATQAENFTTILAISPSPMNANVIWVGTDDGNVQLTQNGGQTWTNFSDKIKGFPKGAWVPQIEVSSHNEGEAFVVANDYRRNNWEPYVFHTIDFGNSWNRLVGKGKVSGHCLSIVQDPICSDLLFLGTENGLYFSIDHGTKWMKWTHDYPSVSTMDLKIHPRESDLIIGTFGRAAYILDDIGPLRDLALNGSSQLKESLIVYPTTDAYMASYGRPRGIRFPGDHHWSAENRSYGANISFYLNPDLFAKSKESTESEEDEAEEDEKEESEKDEKSNDETKVIMHVLNASNDTIRTRTAEPDTGINIIRWGLNENGFRWPTRQKIEEDEDDPGGWRVTAGKYKVILKHKGHEATTSVQVNPDPRLNYSDKVWLAGKESREEFRDLVDMAYNGMEQLKDARKTIDLIKKNSSLLEDSLKKDLKKQAGEMLDSLNALEELYLNPRDFEGYDHVTKRLNNYIWSAYSYMGSTEYEQGQNGRDALNAMRNKTDQTVKRINTFFSETWTPWREEVESIEFKMFNDVKPIE